MAYTAPVVAQRSAALHSISLRTFRNVRTATVRLRCDAVAQCVELLAQEPKKLPQMCGHRERKAGDWNCYKSGGRPATAAQTNTQGCNRHKCGGLRWLLRRVWPSAQIAAAAVCNV